MKFCRVAIKVLKDLKLIYSKTYCYRCCVECKNSYNKRCSIPDFYFKCGATSNENCTALIGIKETVLELL